MYTSSIAHVCLTSFLNRLAILPRRTQLRYFLIHPRWYLMANPVYSSDCPCSLDVSGRDGYTVDQFGAWRRWTARCVWDAEVVGSSPTAPTQPKIARHTNRSGGKSSERLMLKKVSGIIQRFLPSPALRQKTGPNGIHLPQSSPTNTH